MLLHQSGFGTHIGVGFWKPNLVAVLKKTKQKNLLSMKLCDQYMVSAMGTGENGIKGLCC